tara:strand:- start:858 stop:1040 length:183 start_codon:yes stop_codon:yes gene_type:complete
MGTNDGESNSLLPQLTNQKRNHNMSTVQPPSMDENRPIMKSLKPKNAKSKSRLQEYLDQQ